MTEASLIAAILDREGGYVDHPNDRGGVTNWGITSRSWGIYQGYGRPATREEVKAITREQASEFYRKSYLTNSPFAGVAHEGLRVQLTDFSINSGSARACRWLQRVLDVEATGVIDDRTKTALLRDRPVLVSRALVSARLRMYAGIIADDPSQAVFEHGWRNRALSFWE